MTLRSCRAIFVEIHALFPEILRFEFVTLFMKHLVITWETRNSELENKDKLYENKDLKDAK